MPFCRSAPNRVRALWCRWAATLLLALPLLAAAGEIKVTDAAISAADDGYALDAEFDVDIGPRLEEAVSRGVALYFVVEFELTRPRWYWADEFIAGKIQHYRLSYNALTRQYRLSIGALHQSLPNLEDALRVLSRLRHWHVADKAQLKPGEAYNAALRLKLDLAQLPKPFQVTAIGNKDWNVSAEIRRWSFAAGAAEREAK